MPRLHIPAIFLLALGLIGCTSKSSDVETQIDALGTIDFNFQVKPILSKNCFLCHGNDESSREAELRLDIAEGAYAVRDEDQPAIVPGDPSSSLLVQRITSDDPDEVMPPPESNHKLSPLEIGILTRWVEQGAEYKPHWAFIPPEKPDTPVVQYSEWARTDIDRFILARLERDGLEPAPEADRRTLIRRLSFDLTGLPPTVDEIRAFLEDKDPNAYERVVDRLLSSKHFGERMAVQWMDQARYSDTNGYSIDGGRHMWLWRDWVIQAYNQNKPFDEFVVEQLAGDLLPDPTEAQRIATGFNRNHMITHEGGTIPEENLTNYVADRVRTTGEVFMGLTMGCAQCHDHKYDPISQRDYYRFFAYFNEVGDEGLDGDRGINSVPSIEARTVLVSDEEVEKLKTELETLRAGQQQEHPAQNDWEHDLRNRLAERGRDLNLHSLEPLKVTTPNKGYTGDILPDSSIFIIETGWLAAYNVSLRADAIAEPVTGLRVVFYPNPEIQGGRLGHSEKEEMEGSFVMTSITVSAGELPSDQVDLYRIEPIRHVTAGTAHPDFPTTDALDERRQNGWSPHPDNRTQQHFTLTFDRPIDVSRTPYLTVMLNFGYGDDLVAGHFRIFAMTGIDDGTNVPDDIQTILAVDEANRTSIQRDRIRAYFAETAEVTTPIRHQIANTEARLQALTEPQPTMVMNTAEEPRKTYILNRGQYDQPTEEVGPGTLSVLPALPGDTTANRLGLATWLVSPDHPLTARVAVNRYWQMLFGTGLVATSADFGSQGSLPSHPELLDWLAATFMENGWDTKALLKELVMSATYRQSSNTAEELLRRDPQNRLLARGPRNRLPAEFIRDAALKTSGLLVEDIGGPSVNPYQPAGLWKEVSHYGSTPATAQVFVQDHGEKLYRRSLYTYWKRTAPPPSMVTFDAPNREVCTITRAATNTPLQALVLLNDPQFVEAARVFAQRTLLDAPGNAEEKIIHAFEQVTGRLPRSAELSTLQHRLEEELDTYHQAPDQAEALLRVGESLRDPALDPAEHAAWTTVMSLLLNLSETITNG